MTVLLLEQEQKDTAGFVKMIKDAGVDPKVVGVEVISDEILGRGINEAAAYTYENTEKRIKRSLARTGRLIYRNQICSKERGKKLMKFKNYVFSDSDRTNDSKEPLCSTTNGK